jgi:hypothetical protein
MLPMRASFKEFGSLEKIAHAGQGQEVTLRGLLRIIVARTGTCEGLACRANKVYFNEISE